MGSPRWFSLPPRRRFQSDPHRGRQGARPIRQAAQRPLGRGELRQPAGDAFCRSGGIRHHRAAWRLQLGGAGGAASDHPICRRPAQDRRRALCFIQCGARLDAAGTFAAAPVRSREAQFRGTAHRHRRRSALRQIHERRRSILFPGQSAGRHLPGIDAGHGPCLPRPRAPERELERALSCRRGGRFLGNDAELCLRGPYCRRSRRDLDTDRHPRHLAQHLGQRLARDREGLSGRALVSPRHLRSRSGQAHPNGKDEGARPDLHAGRPAFPRHGKNSDPDGRGRGPRRSLSGAAGSAGERADRNCSRALPARPRMRPSSSRPWLFWSTPAASR